MNYPDKRAKQKIEINFKRTSQASEGDACFKGVDREKNTRAKDGKEHLNRIPVGHYTPKISLVKPAIKACSFRKIPTSQSIITQF